MALPILRRRASYHHVYSKGKAKRSDGIVIHYIDNALGTTRYGIAAKTAVGGAVVRNRIRRWTRQILHQWHPHIAAGFDIVVLARSAEASSSYQYYTDHLWKAFNKAELLEDVPELHN